MKKVCIVGVGNMGKAILTALGAAERCEAYGCTVEDDINEKLSAAEVFIIAVKPQDFETMASDITIDLSDKLAISIVAGMSIEKIQRVLKMKKVVRTLPNLPLKIGKAVTCWKASDALSEDDLTFVNQMLETFGVSIELDNENDIGPIGALCGCGPAYFAYLAEQMKKIAMENGLSDEDAEKMASATFVGSGELLEVDGLTAEELRRRITSKGGTTDAAITEMQEKGFDEVFKSGIEAAIKRTKELND